MKTIGQIVALPIILLTFAANLPQTAVAQMGADVRFVADDSMFVIQLDVQKLVGYEKMGSKNLEAISNFMRDQAKIDLMSMKSFTFQLMTGEDPGEFDDDSVGLIMVFSNKVDKKGFLAALSGNYEEAEFQGKKYQRAVEDYQPSVYFPDESTVVMGITTTMEKMIGKKSSDARIRGLLNSADPGSEVKAAFVANDLYRNMLSEISREIPISPFNIEKVFGEAESAVMSVNVKSSTPILVKADCKTEDGAETLAKKGKLLVDLGKASIPIGREQMEAQKKSMEGEDLAGFARFKKANIEMSLKGLDIGEKILAATSTSHKGKKTYLKVKMMGGVKDLIPMAFEMFALQFSAIQQLELEGPGGPIEAVEGIESIEIK